MPGTTGYGFPYALPTDPLVQWPATSQSLAEMINNRFGNLHTVATADTSTAGWKAVTFPDSSFTAAPIVVCTPSGATPSGGVSVRNITTTGFEFHVYEQDLTGIADVVVNWIAVGVG